MAISTKLLREEWVQGIIPWRGVQGPRRPLLRSFFTFYNMNVRLSVI